MRRVRRLICFGLLLALLGAPIALAVGSEADTYEYETKPQVNLTYITQMMQAAMNGEADFMTEGREAEARWNQKLAASAYEFEETAFFELYETAEEIAVAIASYLVANGITGLNGEPLQLRIVASSKNLRAGPESSYDRVGAFPHGTVVTLLGRDDDGWLHVTDGTLTGWCTAIHLAPFDGSQVIILPVVAATPTILPSEIPQTPGQNDNETPGAGGEQDAPAPPAQGDRYDDLYWLALAIQHEAGSDWLCDEHQLWVGNVVLNRVAHYAFPSWSVFEVVHQPGQYPWAGHAWSHIPISERAFANAQRLLNGERFAPANVVWQAQFPQGENVRTFTCSVTGNVHFFDARV